MLLVRGRLRVVLRLRRCLSKGSTIMRLVVVEVHQFMPTSSLSYSYRTTLIALILLRGGGILVDC